MIYFGLISVLAISLCFLVKASSYQINFVKIWPWIGPILHYGFQDVIVLEAQFDDLAMADLISVVALEEGLNAVENIGFSNIIRNDEAPLIVLSSCAYREILDDILAKRFGALLLEHCPEDFFQTSQLDIGSQVYTISGNGSIHEVYQPDPPNGLVMIQEVGQFDSSWSSLQWTASQLWNRRTSLQGQTLRVGYLKNHTPFFYFNDGEISGYFADVLKALQHDCNFTSKFVEESRFGGYFPNGSSMGLMGKLEKGEIDIAAADLTITEDRQRVADFLDPLSSAPIRFIMKNRKKDGMNRYALLQVFDSHVWMLIVLTVSLLGLAFGLIIRVHKTSARNVGFFLYCSILNRDIPVISINDTPLSFQILQIVTLFFFFIFFSCFNATLTSFLSVPTEHSVQTLRDLLKPGISFRLENGSFSERMFLDSKSGSTLHEIKMAKMDTDPDLYFNRSGQLYYPTLLDCTQIELMEQGHILVAPDLIAQSLKLLSDKFYVSPIKDFNEDIVTMAVKKGAPFTNRFNHLLRRYRETGILTKLAQDMTAAMEFRLTEDQASPIDPSLGYTETFVAFAVLTMGVVIGLAALIMEGYSNHFQSQMHE